MENYPNNFVKPVPAKQLPVVYDAPQDSIIHVGDAFNPQATSTEVTSPMARSQALSMRLVPVTGINLVLSLTAAHVLSASVTVGFLIFAVVMGLTYYVMDKAERHDSPTGVEHHRLDAAERLASKKLDNDHEVRMAVVENFRKHLGGE